MKMLLEIRNVSKVYVQGDIETRVLEDINLSINQGDYVALMGPSGSGKSTLLNIISGLARPTKGNVIINGESICGFDESTLASWRSRNIGYIFQQYHLIPVLTTFENVELPLLLFDMSRSERKERVDAALALVGLENRRKFYPRQLSGGQEQRVGVARAIVADPLLLICDEPTGNLDNKASTEILHLFQVLNQRLNKTIIMVTHDRHAAESAKSIEHLEKGYLLKNSGSKMIHGDEVMIK